MFNPIAIQYVANSEFNGQRINPICHYGPNPTILIFARDVGLELQKLVKRLDAEVGKLKDFRLGVCVVLLTDAHPDAAIKKLRSLQDGGKVRRVTLTFLDCALPKGYAIADEAEATILIYERYKIAANHAFRKSELNQRSSDLILADIDKIVPDMSVSRGIGIPPGETQAFKLNVRRDRIKGPVGLKLSDLPKGIAGAELQLGDDESEGWLKVTADRDAPLGQWSSKAIITAGNTRREHEIVIWVRADTP